MWGRGEMEERMRRIQFDVLFISIKKLYFRIKKIFWN